MTFLYSTLTNVDPVPQKFIDLALDPDHDKNLSRFGYAKKTFDQSYLERSVTVDNNSYKTRSQTKYDLGDEFYNWCKKNLHQDCYHTGVSYNKGPSPYQGPHIDRSRKYVLFYLLDAGGVDVTTSFWQHPELPQEPTEQQFPDYACDYPGLNLLDKIVFRPNQWYLFNTRVIHSVENISNTARISFQASLADDSDITEILENNETIKEFFN